MFKEIENPYEEQEEYFNDSLKVYDLVDCIRILDTICEYLLLAHFSLIITITVGILMILRDNFLIGIFLFLYSILLPVIRGVLLIILYYKKRKLKDLFLLINIKCKIMKEYNKLCQTGNLYNLTYYYKY